MTNSSDLTQRHPSVQALHRAFRYEDLPLDLQRVARPFANTADLLLHLLPEDTVELVESLRSLLEARDHAVVAAAGPNSKD